MFCSSTYKFAIGSGTEQKDLALKIQVLVLNEYFFDPILNIGAIIRIFYEAIIKKFGGKEVQEMIVGYQPLIKIS